MSMTPYQPRRVLFLTKLFPYPPAVAGDSVYSRGIIEAWSSVADLSVVCADGGAGVEDGVESVDWHIVDPPRSGRAKSVVSRLPLIAWKGATREYLSTVDRLLNGGRWDAIVLDNIGSAHALRRAERYRADHPETKIVYISHEWEHETRAGKYGAYRMGRIRSAVARRDLKKVKTWEDALIQTSDIVTVISVSDLVPFRRIDSGRKYVELTPGYSDEIAESREISDLTPRRVLMLGGRRSEQKQQVLLDWLEVGYRPLVDAGIELVVAGDIDPHLEEHLAGRYPEVRVLGFVEDLGVLINGARAGIIADTVGSGFKLRLLAHVFRRLPILGLDGAIDGLPTLSGRGYLSSDSLEGLVALVCKAVDDTDGLQSLQETAFHDCASEFSWEERAKTLEAILGDASDGVLQ